MWALGKRGWPGGLPLVGEEGGAQLWKLAFRLEPAEALGGLEHGGERGIATAEVVDPDGGVDEDEAQGSAGLSRRQAGDGAGR